MEESPKMRTASFGGSFPVANVQALAASKNLKEIPQRYIRPELLDDVVCDVDAAIPVIDISRLSDARFFQEEATKLKFACEEWGFFQTISHGVPNEVIERMQVDVQEFFKQPLEQKMKYSRLPGSIEGYGQEFVVSEVQKLNWADLLMFFARPPQQKKMELWPTCPPTFRTALDNYSIEVNRFSTNLLGIISKNLGFEPEKLTDLFREETQGVKMNYYPPCPEAAKVLGIAPHKDASALTVLLQVSDVPGLQVRRNGKWQPIKPLPAAFIVMVGNVLEILSNGKYKSVEHRAVVNAERERLSIATFHNPSPHSLIGPLQDLETMSEPCYKTVNSEDYIKMIFAFQGEGKDLLEHMKLKH